MEVPKDIFAGTPGEVPEKFQDEFLEEPMEVAWEISGATPGGIPGKFLENSLEEILDKSLEEFMMDVP